LKFNEITGDLFTAPDEAYKAHCISADYKLDVGIAVEFDKRYDMSNKLSKCNPYCDVIGCMLIDNVFNLITKAKYYNKPSYLSLTIVLEMMKSQVKDLGIKHLAMPRIGCGLDGLNWVVVGPIIKGVFYDLDIDITIYTLAR